MTSTYVALLRAVNVAGHGKVTMAELRAAFESAGFGDVRTYIQSGNVVFTSSSPVSAADVERAVGEALGAEPTIMLRTAEEIASVAERNPYGDVDTGEIHVGLLAEPPAPEVAAGLDVADLAPEGATVVDADVYLHLPNGVGRSKLPNRVAKQLDAPMTIRNWRTVAKLADLANPA
ncbi:MAG: DUF1697 domain-containing protein [Actinomycetota bacterium]|nr:DUF1697 domain-containing protein [Actinomycetota bacterium]